MAPFLDPAVWSDKDSMEDINDESVPDLVDDHQEAVEELWLERNTERSCWVDSIRTMLGPFSMVTCQHTLVLLQVQFTRITTLLLIICASPIDSRNFSTMFNTNRN